MSSDDHTDQKCEYSRHSNKGCLSAKDLSKTNYSPQIRSNNSKKLFQ